MVLLLHEFLLLCGTFEGSFYTFSMSQEAEDYREVFSLSMNATAQFIKCGCSAGSPSHFFCEHFRRDARIIHDREGLYPQPPRTRGASRGQVPLAAQTRHKKYEKSRRPHDWRSRPDPVEGFWDQITAWLIANPERTGVSLLQQVQDLYPDRFRDTQVRTLQRGLQKLRARRMLTFDDQGTQEPVSGQPAAPVLRAVATVGSL